MVERAGSSAARTQASARAAAFVEHVDAKAGIGECAGRRGPSQAGTDDQHLSGNAHVERNQRRPVSLRAMTRRWISLVPS